MKSFESYLRQVHDKDYHGSKRDMVDKFDCWLSDLDADDLIKHAEDWHNSQKKSVEEIDELIMNYLRCCGIVPGLMRPFNTIVLATAIHNLVYGEGEK